MPCIRALILRNNGINDDHEKEIMQLLSIPKLKSIDLSRNEMERLGGLIGKKLRDEASHLSWIDLT